MDTEVTLKQTASISNLLTNKKIMIPLVLLTACLLCTFVIFYSVFWVGDSTCPTWSPDGRYLAYEFDNLFASQIIVMDADGKNKRTVAKCRGANSPVWSPDSMKISFNCVMDQTSFPVDYHYQSIFIVGADGSNQIQLTYGDFGDKSQQWSPDGNAIVFVSNRDAKEPGPMDQINWDIYLYDLKDGTIFRVTKNQIPDVHPAWSPDGSRIAFFCGSFIHVYNREGEFLAALNGSGTSISWSPDGNAISFSNGQAIYSIDVESRKRTQLIDPDRTRYPGPPTFSPYGNQVAFSAEYDDRDEIFILNTDEESTFQLTSNDATDFSPAWSPDGSKIAYRSSQNNHWNIYTIAPDGSDLQCLTCMPWE